MRVLITALMLFWAGVAAGQAPTYDGVDQSVVTTFDLLDYNNDPAPNIAESLSFSWWMYVPSTPSSLDAFWGTAGYAGGWKGLHTDYTSSSMAFWVGNSHIDYSPLTAGVWHHFAWVYDATGGSENKRYYHNGTQYAHQAASAITAYTGTSTNLVIGRNADSTYPRHAEESLDDFRIYSTALSSNQIARLALDTCEMYDPTLWTNSTLHAIAETWDTGYGNTNLVGAWRGDRTPYGNGEAIVEVKDKSPEGNHGTLEPSIASGPVWHGKVDGRRGVYEHRIVWAAFIDLLDSVASDPTWSGLGEQLTVAFRARPYIVSAISPTAWAPAYTVIELRGEGTSAHIPFSIGFDSGYVHLGVTDNYITGAETENSVTAISVDTWYSVACTINGDDWAIYLDGILDNSGTFTTATGDRSTGTQTANLQIGVRSRDGGQKDNAYYSGFLDYVAVFDGVASSNAIYQLHSAGQFPTNNAVLRMSFDSESYLLPDVTGNGNDGTAVNNPTIGAAR